MHWLKNFNTVTAGSLAILLTSCTNFKAPTTLFITFGASQEREFFENDTADIKTFLNEYTETFRRSNPNINIAYITYKSNNFISQIKQDSDLNLGPDLVLTDQNLATTLLKNGLTTPLPNKQSFDTFYNSRIQTFAQIKGEYTFAPWLINTQIACFNKSKIGNSPGTIDELEKLSSSGKKIGLAKNSFEIAWSAGALGAVSEISSVGNQIPTNPNYPGLRKWLQWLRQAALYKNISFHKDTRELSTKLKKNELDWITCYGSQLEDLKRTMGNNLGIAALPNGTMSKAFPGYQIYGFALGKNSSRTQRKTAIKYIKTLVNVIAQRKIQLDDLGYLATNQNVSIPPEISKIQSAINTSYNKQWQSYSKEEPGIKSYVERYGDPSKTIADLIDGSLDVDEALKILTTPQTN